MRFFPVFAAALFFVAQAQGQYRVTNRCAPQYTVTNKTVAPATTPTTTAPTTLTTTDGRVIVLTPTGYVYADAPTTTAPPLTTVGGCANGQCGTVTTTRGFFRR